MAIATAAWSQPQPGPYYYATFFKVPQGKGDAYIKMEKETWKPIHEYRKKQGEIISWAIYAVDFSGEGSPYNYVAVELFENLPKMDGGNYEQAMKTVHPKRTIEEITKTTLDARVAVRSEMGRMVGGVKLPKPLDKPATMYFLNFMKATPGNEDTYSSMIQNYFLPVWQEQANQGNDMGTAFWEVWFPSDRAAQYNFIGTSPSRNWADTETDKKWADAWKKVHPKMSEANVRKLLPPLRDLIKTEVWWQVTATN